MKTFYENFSYSFSIEESGGITFAPHLHKHVELFYITGGELEVTISGAKTLLRAGDAVVAFPHEIHSYRTPESSRYYMLLFTMDCAPDYADVLTHRRPLNPVVLADRVSPLVPACLKALCSERERIDIRLAKAYISVVIGSLMRCFELEDIARADDLSLPQRALLYMHDRYQEPFTLDDMAAALGVSKHYLSRMFSKKIGVNFNAYRNALRMEHAEKLLLTTTKTITAIAYDCGFDCQRSFNRVFRAAYSMTPREFRAHKA